MNTDEFIQAVRAMRIAQKAYFKDRTQSRLIASKQCEAIVDKALVLGVEMPRNDDQLSLFGDDAEANQEPRHKS